MRIALLVHAYPPGRLGGTELYAEGYARALVRAGHEVFVFAAVKDVDRADLSVRRETRHGVHICWFTNNLFLEDFRATYDRPAVEPAFAEFLREAKPDLLHVMHVADLSATLLKVAKAAGIPVGMTLHDYWFTCPRWGQRFHPDLTICETIEPRKCAECVTRMPWRQPKGASSAARLLRGLKSTVGIDLTTVAKSTLRRLRRRSTAVPKAPAAELRRLEEVLVERPEFLRRELVPHVDLFLAPSRFLASEMARFGIAKERLVVARLGIDAADLRGMERTPSPKLRVAFHGSVMRSKAPHLLLEAWGKLPEAARWRGTLTIRGAQRDPVYGEEIGKLASACGAAIEPEFGRAALPAKLRQTDLLVVPSIWWENSPLAILEALAARVPLLVSELGGMAELVEEGAGGYRFRPADSDDLARRLARFLEDRALLDACVAKPILVRSVDEDARELPNLILQARSPRPR